VDGVAFYSTLLCKFGTMYAAGQTVVTSTRALCTTPSQPNGQYKLEVVRVRAAA
jgi:hypothetical protein